jgi:hypothetical protein
MNRSLTELRNLFESIRKGLGINATIGLFMDEDHLYLQIGFRNLTDVDDISPYTIELTTDLTLMNVDHLVAGIIEDCLDRRPLDIHRKA